jgi:hypothetical protein
MRIKMVIVLIVLVQEIPNLMVVADNLLNGMDNNLLKVVNNHLKAAVNNHLKAANKNLLVVDDLITLLRRMKEVLR